MLALYILISSVIQLYIYIVIAAVIMSWLVTLRVVNLSNPFVYQVYRVLTAITEPALGRIGRYMPNLGGVDLSPVALILLLAFAQNLLWEYWPR